MEEKNLTTCRKCQEKSLRILNGRYPGGKNKYINENGALWSGLLCPSCNTSRVKRAMRASRKAYRDKGLY